MAKRVVYGYASWVDRHRNALLGALLILSVILALLAAAGWQTAREAQSRVSRIEVERQAERIAAETAKRTGQVVTCFSTARNRPRLIAILDSLAEREEDPGVRISIRGLIDEYSGQQVPGIKGNPTRSKCVALARMLEVEYAAYDFDPKTGRLLRPPGDL